MPSPFTIGTLLRLHHWPPWPVIKERPVLVAAWDEDTQRMLLVPISSRIRMCRVFSRLHARDFPTSARLPIGPLNDTHEEGAAVLISRRQPRVAPVWVMKGTGDLVYFKAVSGGSYQNQHVEILYRYDACRDQAMIDLLADVRQKWRERPPYCSP
jgi:hypothetical protein